MPKVEYSNSKGLLQKNGSGGLNINSGRLRQVLTVTDVDAQANTVTAAQINGGIVVHTSVTGGGDATFVNAALIIAGCGLDSDGQCIKLYYINDGDQTVTLADSAGGDTTIADTGNTILENEAAILLIRRTSATAVKVFQLSKSS